MMRVGYAWLFVFHRDHGFPSAHDGDSREDNPVRTSHRDLDDIGVDGGVHQRVEVG